MKMVVIFPDGGNGGEIQAGSIKITVLLFGTRNTGEVWALSGHKKNLIIVWGSIFSVQIGFHGFVNLIFCIDLLPLFGFTKDIICPFALDRIFVTLLATRLFYLNFCPSEPFKGAFPDKFAFKFVKCTKCLKMKFSRSCAKIEV